MLVLSRVMPKQFSEAVLALGVLRGQIRESRQCNGVAFVVAVLVGLVTLAVEMNKVRGEGRERRATLEEALHE